MLGAKSAIQRTLNTNKRSLTITAAAVILGAIIIYLFYVKILKPRINSTYTANKEFVNKGDDDNTVDLMYFYTTWCPYCKKARPEWDKFKDSISSSGVNGVKIKFIEVNCEKEPGTAEKYDVAAYPTIKLVYDGKVIEYDAKTEVDTLKEFVKSSL